MKGFIIKSGGKDYIALLPLEYGWWVATYFKNDEQFLIIVEEDDWATLWVKRGIPIEIPEETS